MEKIEMAEKLREKANISLEEAGAVLESCGWELLDAMILLEKEGKLKNACAHGSSAPEESVGADTSEAGKTEPDESLRCCSREAGSCGTRREANRGRFRTILKKLLRKGMENRFVVSRYDSVILDLPVLAAVILMIVFFWLTVILLIVGSFTHFHYSFTGEDLGRDTINNGIRKATDAAESFAEQLKSK